MREVQPTDQPSGGRSKGCLLFGGCAAILALVLISLALFVFGAYNSLVNMDQDVSKSWAQVENVLQRRADMIPQLVQVVKGYAKHEKEIFEFAAQARSQAMAARTVQDASQANNQITQALSQLLSITEAYPQLQANVNFRDLQVAIEGSENRISVERKRYNDAVNNYNRAAKALPMKLFVGILGFDTEKPYFEMAEGAEKVPEISFD